MAKTTKPSVSRADAPASLSAQLQMLDKAAQASGDIGLHCNLHTALLALSHAKIAAQQGAAAVDGEAAELLAQIAAL